MTTATITPVEELKRSAKKLHLAAVAGGWLPVSETTDRFTRTVTYEMKLDDPAVETIRANTSKRIYGRRGALFAEKAEILTDVDTGAFHAIKMFDGTDADANWLRTEADTVTNAALALGVLARAVKDHYARLEREAKGRLVAAEREAIRERYLEDLAATNYRFRSFKELAAKTVEEPEFDTDDRNLYWAASTMTSYLADILRTRMAARTLDIVGWPRSEYGSDEIGAPITLGEAATEAVAEILGHESSSSTNYESLVAAAKDVLRLASTR